MTLRVLDGDGNDETRERILQTLREVVKHAEEGDLDGALVFLLHDDGYSVYVANVSESEMVWVMERHKSVLMRG